MERTAIPSPMRRSLTFSENIMISLKNIIKKIQTPMFLFKIFTGGNNLICIQTLQKILPIAKLCSSMLVQKDPLYPTRPEDVYHKLLQLCPHYSFFSSQLMPQYEAVRQVHESLLCSLNIGTIEFRSNKGSQHHYIVRIIYPRDINIHLISSLLKSFNSNLKFSPKHLNADGKFHKLWNLDEV